MRPKKLVVVLLSLFAFALYAQGVRAKPVQPDFDRGKIASYFKIADPNALDIVNDGGKPAAYKVIGDGKFYGYVFSSWETSGSVGFSGKPIDIHIALNTDAKIAGAYIFHHQEPILVLGITNEDLLSFVDGFAGLSIANRLSRQDPKSGLPDFVAGATISSSVIQDAILRSSRNVAYSHQLLGQQTGDTVERANFTHKIWPDLAKQRAIGHRLITMKEMRQAFALPAGDNPDGAFIDLYTALLDPPTIGRNLLGQRRFNEITAAGDAGDSMIMVAANGLYSFRGRSWRKTGMFDRIQLVQQAKTITLKKENYRLIETLHAAGAPSFREIALFTIPQSTGFNPTKAWRLDLAVRRKDGGDEETAKTFHLNYHLPSAYIHAAPKPAIGPDATAEQPLWMGFWMSKKWQVVVIIAILAALWMILFFQDALARRKKLYLIIRIAFLLVTVLFIGFYAGAQLSVINVITFIHSLMGQFRWELFLLNPLVFILWGFVAVAMLFWGRGVFCGWLCPFGALQELVNLAARRLGIRQIQVPWGLHERLWPIKYIIFLSIFAISLASLPWAYRLAEVEPFKTVIILKFIRDWQFVFYALALLAAGLFIERFYCRYLCPLGAALAIPARLRMFEWLKRRHECGRECRICATRCTVQAINPMGQISPNECVYCLRCQVNYHDKTTCRALLKRARRFSKPPAQAKPQTKLKTSTGQNDAP